MQHVARTALIIITLCCLSLGIGAQNLKTVLIRHGRVTATEMLDGKIWPLDIFRLFPITSATTRLPAVAIQ